MDFFKNVLLTGKLSAFLRAWSQHGMRARSSWMTGKSIPNSSLYFLCLHSDLIHAVCFIWSICFICFNSSICLQEFFEPARIVWQGQYPWKIYQSSTGLWIDQLFECLSSILRALACTRNILPILSFCRKKLKGCRKLRGLSACKQLGGLSAWWLSN